jgi:hypothetical protein
MRTLQYFFTLSFFSIILFSAHAQMQAGVDSTGLPGDNFSLQGALQMFQNASSPEEFEKMINTEGNHVNNLDLNGDGEIDYVRVVEKAEGKSHLFILQVPVSANENQDIAVIELEKTGDASAVIQIIGDEDIYGEKVIIEPNGNVETNQKINGPGYFQDDFENDIPIIVNVWFWPCVRFVFAPGYRIWVSPWHWGLYPVWWHPWRPLSWSFFRPYHYSYHPAFIITRTHRVMLAHSIYKPIRSTSIIVRTRHGYVIEHYRANRMMIKKWPARRMRGRRG